MTRVLVAVGVLAFVGLLAGLGGSAALAEEGNGAGKPGNGGVIERNLERWKKLPPEERRRLVELHRRWETLPPEKRATIRRELDAVKDLPAEEKSVLREKGERFRRVSHKLVEALPAVERAALEALPPDERRAKVRRLVAEHILERERGKIAKLPAEVRAELERAPGPVERLARLREHQRRAAEGRMRRFIQSLPAEERERLQSLPPRERQRQVRELLAKQKAKEKPPRRRPGDGKAQLR